MVRFSHMSPRWMPVLLMMGLGAVFSLLIACSSTGTDLERVLNRGELRVVSREAATTYYVGPHGPAGLEYELMKRFAERLGVKLSIETPDNIQDILDEVIDGDVDFAAAGLTVTEERKRLVRFTPPYQYITQQLVYRRGSDKPGSLIAASQGHLEVVADSSHAELLRQLSSSGNSLDWDEVPEADSMELLNLVSQNIIDFTIVDSNELALNRRFYPQLNVAFDVSKPQPLAWAFPADGDDSLYQEAIRFFNELNESGELKEIVTNYYRHVRRYDYAGTHTFVSHIKRRLPLYRDLFEQAAEQYGLDWRLLASVAYQESHWNPHAVSPTGVRGIMMLTQATAAHLGVEKRTDAEQSIDGGARYLRALIDKVPENIADPDRTWMGLAAYNVGFGHLQDARQIALMRGDDADKWHSVRRNLPKLRQKKWYKQTRYGYARGNEPVRYVKNIRSYYDILSWYLENEPKQHSIQPILAIATPAL